MRRLQVSIFVLALAALIAALFFIGTVMGDALWRAGIAGLLLDIVVIKLWPTSPGGANAPSEP